MQEGNANVQFEESGPLARRYAGEKGFVPFLINHGIVNDPRQANYLLVGIAALLILGGLFIVYEGMQPPKPTPLPPGAKIIREPGQPPRLAEPLNPPPTAAQP